MPTNVIGTDKITFLASVIGADKDRLTLAISPKNDTDYTELFDNYDSSQTYTFASTMYEWSTSDFGPSTSRSSPGGYEASQHCEMQQTASEVTCTLSWGSELRRELCYDYKTGTAARPRETVTQLWTYSNSETAGVETIVRTFAGSPTTPAADFCSAGEDAPIPSSELQWEAAVPKEDFGTFTMIITAGEEKMKPTAGGAATTSGAEPTGSESGNGASAPMRTMAPALAGLGAIAAVFL